jgi:hypothetical protein
MAEYGSRGEVQQLDPSLSFGAPELADIVAYWRAKAGQAGLPTRAQIDPVELSRHLGYLVLVDVLGAPPSPRLRYRLIGTAITALTGRDATGRYLDELYDEATYRSVIASYLWVIEHRQPIRVYGTMQFVNRDWVRFEAVDLPLGDAHGSVNVILSRQVFSRE